MESQKNDWAALPREERSKIISTAIATIVVAVTIGILYSLRQLTRHTDNLIEGEMGMIRTSFLEGAEGVFDRGTNSASKPDCLFRLFGFLKQLDSKISRALGARFRLLIGPAVGVRKVTNRNHVSSFLLLSAKPLDFYTRLAFGPQCGSVRRSIHQME